MIRKIKAEDKEIYIKMAHDFYRMPAVDHPVPDSYLEKTFEECLKSDTYAELFILEWEGKIAGYGLIAKTFSQEAGGMVYWLEELYILEEYRSKGLGSEYFRYMEEHKEEGVTRFRLEVGRFPGNPFPRCSACGAVQWGERYALTHPLGERYLLTSW